MTGLVKRQGHMVTITELTGSDVGVGLTLLVETGFSRAFDDGLTSTETLLGARSVEGTLVGALRGSRLTAFRAPVVALLGVKPEHRARGVGTALLDAFCEREFTSGATHVEVHVAPGTHLSDLARFYQSAGFRWIDGVYRRNRQGSVTREDTTVANSRRGDIRAPGDPTAR